VWPDLALSELINTFAKQARRRLQEADESALAPPPGWLATVLCCAYLWIGPVAFCYSLAQASTPHKG
jgi:hypothetical protein